MMGSEEKKESKMVPSDCSPIFHYSLAQTGIIGSVDYVKHVAPGRANNPLFPVRRGNGAVKPL
jgi:hypothetical protein